MPAQTTVYIDKYHPKENEKCAIYIRVTFERKRKYYTTGTTATVDEYQKAIGEGVRGKAKELSLKLQAFEKKAADIIDKLPVFTFIAFEKQFYTNRATKNNISTAFKNYADELRAAGRIGTAVSYECAQNSLSKFAPEAKFIDITPELLRKYESWMLKGGKSITTVGIYLRSLRTLMNNAISDGLLTKDYYPFGRKRYEIPTSNNIKKALTLKDIGKIYNFKAEPESFREKYKDYWIFMYLANGMNVKDMSLLTYSSIKSDVIEFIRAKTTRTKRKVEPIRVMLTDDLKAIIKKWGNKQVEPTDYIFPILEKGCNAVRERQLIQQLTGVINDHMKAIAAELEIDQDVTTYAARHSFSTVLQRSGVSTEFISEALGHSNVKTTANYLAGFEDDSKREHAKALTAFIIKSD
ncbi:MAG: site-specific integrase [Bacteroidota bacterium]